MSLKTFPKLFYPIFVKFIQILIDTIKIKFDFVVDWSLENFVITSDYGYETYYEIEKGTFAAEYEIELNDKAIKALKELGMASPINLKYIISAEEDSIKKGEPSIDPIKEGRIQFNVEVREGTGCSSKSAYDYKYVDDKKPEEGTAATKDKAGGSDSDSNKDDTDM